LSRCIALVAGDSDAAARTDRARDRVAALSPREHDVALAAGRGHGNAEIAAALHRSVPTVKVNVSRVSTSSMSNRVQIALRVQDASGHQSDLITMALPSRRPSLVSGGAMLGGR
jgi:DNA-binding NarL/FixJ family response regulator